MLSSRTCPYCGHRIVWENLPVRFIDKDGYKRRINQHALYCPNDCFCTEYYRNYKYAFAELENAIAYNMRGAMTND